MDPLLSENGKQKQSIPDISQTKLSPSQYCLFKCYFNNEIFVGEFPKYIIIESTNCCNLNCIMCPRKEMTRPQGYMKFDLFKKIIDECEGRVEMIYLHLFGEPLLHKKIFDFIDYAGGKGITIGLATNATLLDQDKSSLILKSKLDFLVISIDSLKNNVLNEIRPGISHREVHKKIKRFVELHKTLKSNLSVSLQMIEMNINKSEIEDFKYHRVIQNGINYTIKQLCSFANQVKDNDKLGFHMSYSTEKTKCMEPWRGMVIGWDGVVVPCHNDYDNKYTLGDIKYESIFDVWNSERMKEMRCFQVNGWQKRIELCKNCMVYNETLQKAISNISSFNPSRKECNAYIDNGLYDIELNSDYECQWTRKIFSIAVQDRFQDITFIFCNDNPHKETIDVRICLFGEFITNATIGRYTEVIIQTPERYKGCLLRVDFTLECDWIPQKAGINNDTRNLGIRIYKIIN